MKPTSVIRPEFASVEARRMEFPGQLPGERVLTSVSPAASLWLGSLPAAAAFGVGAWALFQLVAQTFAPALSFRDERAILFGAVVFLLVPVWFILVYRNTRILVTDRRIVYATLRLPGVEERRTMPFRDVATFSVYEPNPLYRFFRVGRLRCEPKSGAIHLPLDIPHMAQANDFVAYLEQVRKLGFSGGESAESQSALAA